jgi:hypothetical protein
MKRTADSSAVSLLESSPEARSHRDLRRLVDSSAPPPSGASDTAPLSIGMAVELPTVDAKAARGPRLVVLGTPSVAWSRNFVDPSLLPASLLVENAFAWLGARPALVSVPERKAKVLGLNLTEGSRAEVLRYVLVYMPGTAGLLGLLVLVRRRRVRRPTAPEQGAA